MNIFFNVTILNQKLRFVNFRDNSEEHFIINDATNNIELIYFKTEKYLNSFIEKYEIGVFQKDNNFSVIFYLKEYENELNDFGIPRTVDFFSSEKDKKENFDIYHIKIKHSFSIENKASVVFRILDNNETTFSKKFIFYKYNAHNHNLISAALDFGSEASQLIQHNKENALKTTIEPVVMGDFLANMYNTAENFKFSEYIQSSKENDNSADKYLRSIFFYQSKNAKKDNGNLSTNSYFQFLTKENEIADLFNDKTHQYKILPNLKLSYISSNNHSVNFEDEDNSSIVGDKFIIEIKKIILSNFITSLIKSNQTSKDLLIKFTLLYPNVYNQQTINKLNLELNEIFNSKVNNKQIFGYEFDLLSESDAAFLGIKNKFHDDIKNNKDYIVIDSGKGTTDYSLIVSSQNNTHQTIFRTGFVGAGNLITFSFLVALLNDIAKEKNETIENIARKLLKKENLSISKLFSISNKINNIKIAHGNTNTKNIFSTINIETTDIETIIQNISHIEDKGKYIEGAVNFIVNKIENDLSHNIKTNTIIYLSGRSFKFKPLLEKLKMAFIHKCEKIIFIEQYPKTISLLGAFSNNSANVTIEGVPKDVDDTFIKQKNSYKDIIFDSITKIKIKASNLLNDQQREMVNLSTELFLEKGADINLSTCYKIICSNSRYSLPQNLIEDSKNNPNKRATIRFDGTKFIILYNNKIYDLINDFDILTDEEKLLNDFSAFPFINQDNFIEYILLFEKFLKENYISKSIDYDDLPVLDY